MALASTKQQREAWLVKATRRIIKHWATLGVTVPLDVQLSCGFPGGGSPRRRIGECWPRERSAAKINQVFVNPTIDAPAKALDILGHELLHAVDNCESGHGAVFSRNSRLVGYSGGKHSHAESKGAIAFIARLQKQLGTYPNSALHLGAGQRKQKKTDGLQKFECVECGEDVLYSTASNVEKHGAPRCRCCAHEMEPAQRKKKKVVTTI